MYTQEAIAELIRKFVTLISDEITVNEVYLFGSYATGNMHQYSDIDLAIVSDDFEGIRFSDRKRLNKYLLQTSIDLEIHPFRSEDFTPDMLFVEEILRTGKKM